MDAIANIVQKMAAQKYKNQIILKIVKRKGNHFCANFDIFMKVESLFTIIISKIKALSTRFWYLRWLFNYFRDPPQFHPSNKNLLYTWTLLHHAGHVCNKVRSHCGGYQSNWTTMVNLIYYACLLINLYFCCKSGTHAFHGTRTRQGARAFSQKTSKSISYEKTSFDILVWQENGKRLPLT